VLPRHQTRRLVGVVPDLMQRDQLVGERVCVVLVHVLVGEADGIVEIGSLGHRVVAQRVQVRRHRVYRREGRVAGGFRYGRGVVGAHGTGGRNCVGNGK